MGFRFRKKITLFPGVSINIGKKSVSVSAGVPGARITKGLIGSNKTTKSVGLVGTGISFTEQTSSQRPAAEPQPLLQPARQEPKEWGILTRLAVGFAVLVVLTMIFKR